MGRYYVVMRYVGARGDRHCEGQKIKARKVISDSNPSEPDRRKFRVR
jgi:hypothetical protein